MNERELQNSTWLPMVLSIVVHAVLVFTIFQVQLLEGVFMGDPLKRLPELERLDLADQERLEQFIRETTVLETPADPEDLGGSQVSGLEYSRYRPISSEPGLPQPTESVPVITSPSGDDRLIADAELETIRPLLPPGETRRTTPGPTVSGVPGIPAQVLQPPLTLPDMKATPPSLLPVIPAYALPVLPTVTIDDPVLLMPPLPAFAQTTKVYDLNDHLETILEVYREPATGEDFFRLSLRVRASSDLRPFAKDNLFLIDASNSVKDPELQKVFAAVSQHIRSMPPNDRYNIVKFHLREESLFLGFNGWSNDDVGYLMEFLKRPERSILTNLANTVGRTLTKFPGKPGRPMNVHLFTDGVVTAGDASISAVTSKFSNSLGPNQSLLPFNIGRPANIYMMEMISFTGRGYHGDCEDVENASAAIAGFLDRFNRPVLVECEAQYISPAVRDIYPLDLPVLYRDNTLQLYGKCETGSEFAFRLKGQGVNGESDIFIRTALPDPDPELREIAREWARGRIYQLLSAYFHEGAGQEALEKVRSLAMRYGINLPFDINR